MHKELGYGVMVTLQILVLPFLVRVRVPQQNPLSLRLDGFFLSIRLFFSIEVTMERKVWVRLFQKT